MRDEVNLFKMEDSRLESLANQYREMCSHEGSHLLRRNGKIMTFGDFAAAQNAAEMIRSIMRSGRAVQSFLSRNEQ